MKWSISSLKGLFSQWIARFPRGVRDWVRTCLYGLAGGLIAVLFQLAIRGLWEFTWPRLAQASLGMFLGGSFVLIMGTSLIAGVLMTCFCPEAAGSGIPQLKVNFWRDFGFLPFRPVIVKFIAGALTIGGGSSLGREGPSVHIAGALASNIAGVTGVAKQGRRAALAAGAASGLAAAFNTPMSAVTFVLEEIIEDLNNARYLGQTLMAAVLATLVTHWLIGKNPAFIIPAVPEFSPKIYLLGPVVALASSLIGVLFQKWTLDWRDHINRKSRAPKWCRPAIGAFFTWILGVSVFCSVRRLGVFGLGYYDLGQMLDINIAWQIVVILLFAKLLATVSSYAWGGCGGIFAPTLFLGASTGLACAGLVNEWMPLTTNDQIVLVVVGMSTCLGAVVRAPITSMLIVFEMTHEFSFVPVLMLGTVVSQAVSRVLLKENFYSDILTRDGFHLKRLIPPRTLTDWQNQEVGAIAHFNPVFATSLEQADLLQLLEKCEHQRFPVLRENQCVGIVDRNEVERAVAANREVPMMPVTFVNLETTVADARDQLIDSPSGMVVVIDERTKTNVGVLTLHDLLRAEAKAVEADSDN